MEIIKTTKPANILVIGANGGIGKQCVILALAAGHKVTALVRNPAKLTLTHPNLQVVKGDVFEPESMEKHLEDCEVVISALGVSGGLFDDKPTTTYSEGNENLLRAMKKQGVKRAFFISASALDISPDLPFFIRLGAKYIIQKLLKNMYADLCVMEKIVKQSHAEYTIIRPPRLTDGAATGKYRFVINQFLKNSLKISRADVAHFILSHLNDEAIYQTTIEVAY